MNNGSLYTTTIARCECIGRSCLEREFSNGDIRDLETSCIGTIDSGLGNMCVSYSINNGDIAWSKRDFFILLVYVISTEELCNFRQRFLCCRESISIFWNVRR